MNTVDDLYAQIVSLETRYRALTASVIRLSSDCEQAEAENDDLRRAIDALRDENEALVALVTAFVRGELVLPNEEFEVRH